MQAENVAAGQAAISSSGWKVFKMYANVECVCPRPDCGSVFLFMIDPGDSRQYLDVAQHVLAVFFERLIKGIALRPA